MTRSTGPAEETFDSSPHVLYKGQRFEVRVTETFESWLDKLRDRRGRARMLNQLRKLGDGNFGNAKPVARAFTSCGWISGRVIVPVSSTAAIA